MIRARRSRAGVALGLSSPDSTTIPPVHRRSSRVIRSADTLGMTNSDLTIDKFLTPFVADFQAGKPITTALRIERLDKLLRECVEAQDGTVQCVECRAILSIEKVFNPIDPFATSMNVDRLLWALGAFVHSPWLRSDPEMQAEQWRFTKAIVDAVQRTPRFEERFMTPELARQIAMLRDHVKWGLHRTAQARRGAK
jgi:hypothetical protein